MRVTDSGSTWERNYSDFILAIHSNSRARGVGGWAVYHIQTLLPVCFWFLSASLECGGLAPL